MINARDRIGLAGKNGAGKSTLLNLVAGLFAPTSGVLLAGDREIAGPGPDRAVVFQAFALFPWKTVWDNIDFGLRSLGVDFRQITDD